jgi:hypothetical protein
MMRAFYLAAAAVMFGWIAVATTLWLGQHGGDVTEAFVSVWQLATADWMLLLVLTDMLVFTVAAFVWVALDLRARGATALATVVWLGPMLLLGSAVLFFYLARRTTRPVSPAVL